MALAGSIPVRLRDASRADWSRTADGRQHTFAPSPAAMTALLTLAKTDAILLWDPVDRTLIAANIVGTWLAPTGLTRVNVAAPAPGGT